MTADLKLCPFCGGGAGYVKHSAGMPGTMGFDSWHAVACRTCGATVGACDRRFRNKDDAAAAWNVRPAPGAPTVGEAQPVGFIRPDTVVPGRFAFINFNEGRNPALAWEPVYRAIGMQLKHPS